MDVILIFNGLGNQMSQYAFYLNKKRISPSTRFIFSKKSSQIHNGYELERVFGIPYHDTIFNRILFLVFRMAGYQKINFFSRPFLRIFRFIGISIIYENDDYNFKPEYLQPSRGIVFYVGGWHSEKYFIEVREEVRKAFQFNQNQVGVENRQMLEQIKKSNSVSVHVRRGDFLNAENYQKLGAVCTLNYFVCAIQKIHSFVGDPHFFFFTNDADWVKTHFHGDDVTVVAINQKEHSWKDMFLISRCANHINSNGSFSWWSAWLDSRPGSSVIVPKNFLAGIHFDDIYPDGWIQLADY